MFSRCKSKAHKVTFDGPALKLDGIDINDADGLTKAVNHIATNFYAPSTTKTMTSQVTKFFKFLSHYSLWLHTDTGTHHTVPELRDTHLIFFAGWLVTLEGFTSHSSVAQYVSAVRQWCRHNGRPDPAVDTTTNQTSFQFYRFMKAIKRKYAGKKTTRVPLSLRQLDHIIDMIDSGLVCEGIQAANMRAAVLNAFAAMLRVSEYTHATHDGVLTGATRGDVEFFGPDPLAPEGYRLRILKSKTDQFRVGHVLTIFSGGVKKTCPVHAMYTLFTEDPRQPDAPLFFFRFRDPSTTAFTVTFDKILSACNIPTSNIRPHSLRSGGASAYLQTGTDPYVIAKMGRWASYCFTIYTYASRDHLRAAARGLAHGKRESSPINLEPLRAGAYTTLYNV